MILQTVDRETSKTQENTRFMNSNRYDLLFYINMKLNMNNLYKPTTVKETYQIFH